MVMATLLSIGIISFFAVLFTFQVAIKVHKGK